MRDNRLFQGFKDETLEHLARELPSETVEPGELLIAEGEVASHMYVLLNGEVEVLTASSLGKVRVALLGPGDWVGEMAILDVQPRSATVRALAPTLLLKLTSADVRRLLYDTDLSQYALLMMNIARELSRRLRVADHLIAESSTKLAQRYVVAQSRRPPPLED